MDHRGSADVALATALSLFDSGSSRSGAVSNAKEGVPDAYKPLPEPQLQVIEDIIDRRRTKGGSTEYLVRWFGYSGEDSCTWVAPGYVFNAGMLAEFDRAYDSACKQLEGQSDDSMVISGTRVGSGDKYSKAALKLSNEAVNIGPRRSKPVERFDARPASYDNCRIRAEQSTLNCVTRYGVSMRIATVDIATQSVVQEKSGRGGRTATLSTKQKGIAHSGEITRSKSKVQSLGKLISAGKRKSQSKNVQFNYDVGDAVLGKWGGKWHNAKVLRRNTDTQPVKYFVTWEGWGKKWDTWIEERNMQKRSVGEGPDNIPSEKQRDSKRVAPSNLRDRGGKRARTAANAVEKAGVVKLSPKLKTPSTAKSKSIINEVLECREGSNGKITFRVKRKGSSTRTEWVPESEIPAKVLKEYRSYNYKVAEISGRSSDKLSNATKNKSEDYKDVVMPAHSKVSKKSKTSKASRASKTSHSKKSTHTPEDRIVWGSERFSIIGRRTVKTTGLVYLVYSDAVSRTLGWRPASQVPENARRQYDNSTEKRVMDMSSGTLSVYTVDKIVGGPRIREISGSMSIREYQVKWAGYEGDVALAWVAETAISKDLIRGHA